MVDDPSPPASVDLILPVLNEEEALHWVLPRVPSGARAIVVDNGSTDASAAVAAAAGATVVSEPRPGFGSACWAGLCAASADVVVFCDADASIDPGDLWLVATPVIEGELDLAMGARRTHRSADWPPHARAANRYLARLVGRRTGVSLTDLGPLRAARREPLLRLGIEDRRFGWPLEMVFRAANDSWRIGEIPVDYRARIGTSKVTGTVRGTARAVRDMRRVIRDDSFGGPRDSARAEWRNAGEPPG